MTNLILSNHVASISELKANPMGIVNSAAGDTVAILNRNQPVFYAVPAETYAKLMEAVDNMEIAKMIESRKNQETVKVSLDEL